MNYAFTNDRDLNVYVARVYLAQAKAFRQHANFHAVLLKWAAKARLNAMKATRQFELFEPIGDVYSNEERKDFEARDTQ